MKTTLILTAALASMLIFGAHGYSKPKDSRDSKRAVTLQASKGNPGDNKEEINTIGNKRVKCTTVKNIWGVMLSYDKYGNEITERARLNMMENAELLKANQNKSKETSLNQEVK